MENIKTVKKILFYFILCVNIWTVRRLARDLGEDGTGDGTGWHGAARHVYVTRSYGAVIPLPRFVQAGSRVRSFFTLFFEILSY